MKKWTEEEFINAYKKLKSSGLNDKEIANGLGLSTASEVEQLLYYYRTLKNDSRFNNILKDLKKRVDDGKIVPLCNLDVAYSCPRIFVNTAVTVLRNDGYNCYPAKIRPNRLSMFGINDKINEDECPFVIIHFLTNPESTYEELLDFVFDHL